MKSIILLCCFASVYLSASVSVGKKIYHKECASCHLEGKFFASHKKAKEWSRLLKDNNLDTLHQDINITLQYFKSRTFQEDKKHLKHLLQKYSKDRGKHNSCY